MRKILLLVAVGLAACGDDPQPPPKTPVAATASAVPTQAEVAPPKATTKTLTADEAMKTPAGAAFMAPRDWTVTIETPRAVLVSPEKDMKIGIVDVPNAKDAAEAVAIAWKAFGIDQKHPIKVTLPNNPKNGWEEDKTFAYETSPNEKRAVVALARRKGTAWTVLMLDGAEGSVEKRGSQIDLIASSTRPAGYERESFAGKKAHELDKDRIAKIVDMVEAARKQGDVPGIGLALIQNGKVIYSGGLGVREQGKPEKVDENTRFMIASNTKAMTTLMLAKLVDEKKLNWDDPVVKVDPSFKLGDAEITKQVLVKHLICACTGMPRQDLEWLLEWKDRTPQKTMDLLGTMKPTSKFGEVFQYSNIMAAAAGFVGGKIAYPGKELGAAYDEAMKSRVFGPLGMTDTTFDYPTALRGNHASPHGFDVDGKTQVAKMDVNYSVIPARPAGGAWSTTKDVAKYVMMELANGKLPDGKSYVSETNLLARRKPQISEGEDVDYGMGLTIDNRYKIAVIHHGGDMIGFHSDMFWIPEANVGGVILTNADAGPSIRRPFLRKTLEMLYDGKDEAEADAKTSIERMKTGIAEERKHLTVPADMAVVDKIAGTYKNADLGTVTIKKKDKRAIADFGEFSNEMATRKNDDGTTSIYTIDPGTVGIDMVIADPKDGKRTMIMRDAQHEYVFTETK